MSDDKIEGWLVTLQGSAMLLCLVFFGPQTTMYIMLGYLCLWLLFVVGVLVVIWSPLRRFNNLLKGLFIKLFKLERQTITKRTELPAHLKARVADLNRYHDRLKRFDPELASVITDLSVAIVVCFKVARPKRTIDHLFIELNYIVVSLERYDEYLSDTDHASRPLILNRLRRCLEYVKSQSLEPSVPTPATDPKVQTLVVPSDLQTMLSYLNAGHHSLDDEELSIQLRDAIVETEYFAKHFMTQTAEATIMAQLKLIRGLLADCQVAKACPAALAEVVKYDVLQQQALASITAFRQIITAQLAASIQELHTRSDDAADHMRSMAIGNKEVHMHR